MDLEKANKIVNIWGKYLEYCYGRLSMLFLHNKGKIPESLLPFHKSILDEALNKMDKYYFEVGNKEGMMLMRETMMLLELFENDEIALKHVGENLSNNERRKQISESIKDWQQTWLESQKY